ncbi:DgyrCDS6284 [Dimorphilus gyrociliatus]|uniref:Arginyl-tRNA--protein transferase 1 n=1 Tax=Dimorphilus gyrociliatus TaxID=2664684 RepID=A0A7I8VMS6_9ANNE|nr:DgyrCDS6284 [Dimorphilus gyrociliatus]
MNNRTVVQYHSSHADYSCGYCKGASNSSYGMSAYDMSVQDYQDLIDRGWRRSGTYCYKPILDKQCCPSYTIKQQSLDFSISKGQRKTIKSFNKFLNTGEIGKSFEENSGVKASNGQKQDEAKRFKSTPKPGAGPDPSKPPCRKAKERRKEEKLAKKASAASTKFEKAKKNQAKSLEELLNDISPNPKHNLKIVLVQSNMGSEEFKRTFEKSYEIYFKYQTTIHNDPPSKPSRSQFTRFLINSPLKPEVSGEVTYGSFHQQYWLDDRLIAVGVIDILPKCVSSVYLFYDPEFNFLTLGTYSALREISFVRELHAKASNIEFYYMGFYIHSCPKMRYKGQYHPSYLLCPESYSWHPIEECKRKLDQSKYSRFSNKEDRDEDATTDFSEILIYRSKRLIAFETYRQSNNTDDIKEYARHVGKKCAKRMILFK